jgi:hypothetical protein
MRKWSNRVLVQALRAAGIRSQIETGFDALEALTGLRTRVVPFREVGNKRLGHIWLQSGRGLVVLGLFTGGAYVVGLSNIADLVECVGESPLGQALRGWNGMLDKLGRRATVSDADFYELCPRTTEVRLQRVREQPAAAHFTARTVMRELESSGLTVSQHSKFFLHVSGRNSHVIMRAPSKRGSSCLGIALIGSHQPEPAGMALLRCLSQALGASLFDCGWAAQVDFNDPYYKGEPTLEDARRPMIWFPE